ncbi:MAG: hypothetical protein DHS20C18_46970 [Saprospiraceae bacterium]|nr:MAG: hypothetical protein DHS20C18_46970 [Saprospiraceae bacterium]
MEFSKAKEIIDIDSTTELPASVIPVKIRNYVQANYPNSVITDWELENGEQHVELNNDVDLVFDLNSDFLRLDD